MDCGAAASLYGAVEGAFGSDGGAGGDGDVGECPAASAGSEEECAGAVSNCWSPGQRDTGGKLRKLRYKELTFLPNYRLSKQWPLLF